MKRILFVDDEPKVLGALRRSLFDRTGEWQCEFVESGAEALERFESEPFDIVVSDMRMPGMDGADLLWEIRKRSPQSARLILSGQSDRNAVLKALGPTHQFLAKPCPRDVLVQAIERISHLQDRLASPRVRAAVGDIESLPALPATFRELTARLDDPQHTLDELAAIVERDPGLTADVLRIVNSAFFGLQRPAGGVKDALSYIGIDTLRTLVLGLGLFQEFDSRLSPRFPLEALWQHSLRSAQIARGLARCEGLGKPDALAVYLAAIMHDLGRLALFQGDPDLYGRVQERAEELGSNAAAEFELLGVTHGEAGGCLLGLWGFNYEIVQAVLDHQAPWRSEPHVGPTSVLVHLASELERLDDPLEGELGSETIAWLGRRGSAERLRPWREAAAAALL